MQAKGEHEVNDSRSVFRAARDGDERKDGSGNGNGRECASACREQGKNRAYIHLNKVGCCFRSSATRY